MTLNTNNSFYNESFFSDVHQYLIQYRQKNRGKIYYNCNNKIYHDDCLSDEDFSQQLKQSFLSFFEKNIFFYFKFLKKIEAINFLKFIDSKNYCFEKKLQFLSIVHYDRSELFDLLFEMKDPVRSNLFQDLISSYDKDNFLFLDSSKTPYSISKHSYFYFENKNIDSLIKYFQYFKKNFVDVNTYSIYHLNQFYDFVKHNVPNEYWEQLNFHKIESIHPLVAQSENRLYSIEIYQDSFIKKYYNLQFNFNDYIKIFCHILTQNPSLTQKFDIQSIYWDKSTPTSSLIKKKLIIETKENFSFSTFSFFIEKFFDYFNSYFLSEKISSLYQEEVIQHHLPNLEKLVNYSFLNNSFIKKNDTNFLKSKNSKI